MQNLIKSFFTSKRQLMGISITPEAGVEVALFDTKSKTVKAYGQKQLEFNPIKKMVDDLDELSAAIEEILDEIGVEAGTHVVLNLPSYYFGFLDCDAIYTNTAEGIHNSIISEVEQSYLFKQNVPIISYIETFSNLTGKARLAYAAIQKNMAADIKDVISGLGFSVVAIENSYSSIIKTVEYFGLASDELNSQRSWGLISINQNSYTIFSFVGNNLADIYEDPIAIKTFEKDEVNYAVASVINSNLQYYNFASILIVNNSSDINARDLANQFNTEARIKYVENNGKRVDTFFNISNKVGIDDAAKISLYALGAAIYNAQERFIVSFNLNDTGDDDAETAGDINLFGVPVELTDENWYKLVGIVLVIFLIIILPIHVATKTFSANFTSKTTQLTSEIASYQARIDKNQIPKDEEVTFNPIDEITKIVKSNEFNVSAYRTLGLDIPSNIWLTYFYGNQDSAFLIRGQAYYVDDIYHFYKGVKDSVENSQDISLTKVAVGSKMNGRDTYEFEITNNQFNNIVNVLKLNSKEFKDAQTGQQKIIDTDYSNSYFPMYPVSDNSIISPGVQEENAREDALKKSNNAEFDSVDIQNLKNLVPPT